MDKELLKGIAIAGLFHDIGKFAERTYMVEPGERNEIWKKYGPEHAYHTKQVLADLFPESVTRVLGKDPGGTCTILDLAAYHHRPRNPLETIIQQADHIAAGHEREPTDEEAARYRPKGRERKSQIPLISILSRIGLPGQPPDPSRTGMRYRIRVPPLDRTMDDEEIYPCPQEEYESLAVREDYKGHWQQFIKEIKPQQPGERGLDIIDHFDTLLEVCRLYQWCLPETTRAQDLSDVSLFEHQKATAAIATCLYYYHEERNSLKESAIKKRDPNKFLLFCGDISGIQQFVYQISSKGAYKMLKGRSFYIQLLAEILARKYVEEFALTPANILYCSGGKFYLLLPNARSVRPRLAEMTEDVNRELFDMFNGDVYLRSDFEKMSSTDLTRQKGRTLSEIWDDLARKVFLRDRHRYADLAANDYERVFGVAVNPHTASCSVCHCTMTTDSHAGATDDEIRICDTCRDMKEIGKKLKETRYIVMSANRSTVASEKPTMKIFGKHLWFLTQKAEVNGDHGLIWALNSTSFPGLIKSSSGTGRVNAAPLIVGGNHSFDKEFQEIAETAQGVHRLGVLRMDVDNLGRIFRQGLNHYHHTWMKDTKVFHSLGRITTLSWQLAFFFGGLVPKFINQHPEWQGKGTVVYAGGDDLFVLSAWDMAPDIACAIQERFTRFCCQNPVFAMSGGLVLTGGKFPIYKGADMAGAAEQKAKNNKTVFKGSTGPAGEEQKKSFTFLDTSMHWDEFAALKERKERLMALLTEPRTRPLLARLQAVATSWYKSRERLKRYKTHLPMPEIRQLLQAEKWRWQMVYSLARFGGPREEIEPLQRFILEPVAGTTRPGIELLGVLGRWCELLLRRPQNQKGGE